MDIHKWNKRKNIVIGNEPNIMGILRNAILILAMKINENYYLWATFQKLPSMPSAAGGGGQRPARWGWNLPSGTDTCWSRACFYNKAVCSIRCLEKWKVRLEEVVKGRSCHTKQFGNWFLSKCTTTAEFSLSLITWCFKKTGLSATKDRFSWIP